METTDYTDESGYEAWLRYPKIEDAGRLGAVARLGGVVVDGVDLVDGVDSVGGAGCIAAALSELELALSGFCGEAVELRTTEAGLRLCIDESLPEEGYRIEVESGRVVLAGGTARGVLYGMFGLLREVQLGVELDGIALESAPRVPLRMLNHWDNPVEDPVMGSIERVKGGKTIFDWTDLSYPNPRYRDYARLLASIGINGVCINNVNATAEILDTAMLPGLRSLAEVWRAWGIRLYLAIDYASPVMLGGLPTADPLDERVVDWWREKVTEIYAAIPDFGGFVVKADSEGRPGPGLYGRDHVEGSHCLAAALAPFGGILFWRAFVYGRDISKKTPHARAAADRANHASYEFMDLDGQFDDNVILQIKRSATDFQIWEPPHALFGKLPRTRVALEFDLAHEYTGYDVHLAWEGPYLSRVWQFELEPGNPASRIADVVAGKAGKRLPGAVTAVANSNSARNWFGHLLAGAGLYAHGRMAWDPDARSENISREYAQLMFGAEVAPVVAAMLDRSYDTAAKYFAPCGLGFLYEALHHYDPDPWGTCNPNGITDDGVGYDRTSTTGSGYAGLYAAQLAAVFDDPKTCPPEYLLYFHHLPWTHVLPEGRSLIQAIYDSCYEGADEVCALRRQWRGLHGKIDLARWAHVYEKLAQQADHAERWRDLLCRFFREQSGIADTHHRFDLRTPSPHARVCSGFTHAVEDYHARVARLRSRIQAITGGE
jgi:alpha-glucuronidase